MDDIEVRLMNCFSAVFPELTDEQILSATSTTVRSWDSVAVVTLVAVVEEEFGVSLEPDDLSRLSSFGGFLSSLRRAELGRGDTNLVD
jgi:acyl carrier protein